MNQIFQYISQSTKTSSLICLLLVCICSCVDDESVISPEDFPKIEQENLGDQLFDALTRNGSSFDLLDRAENEFLYYYIERLYKQSYFILRAKQGWTTSRDWRIAIFVDENQAAFTFPGGNMMISTGMLKTFRKENELFYLMSFENTLMDEGFLFANFLTFVEDSIDVERLLEERNREDAYLIAQEMVEDLEFNVFITQDVDIATIGWICESSKFRVDGIRSFLPKLEDDSNWLTSRMSSDDRLDSVSNIFLPTDCDNDERLSSLRNSFYVNEILPLIP